MVSRLKNLQTQVEEMKKLYFETHNEDVLNKWRRVTVEARDEKARIKISKIKQAEQ